MAAIISLLVGFIEFALVFRFIFLLLGADPTNGFVAWIYNVSGPLVAPFSGIFGRSTITDGVPIGNTFETASIIAILVYGIIGAVVMRIFNHVGTRPK